MKSGNRNLSESVSIPVVVLLLILGLFVLERINRKVDRSTNGKRTKWLMIAVIISNAVHCVVILTKFTMCLHCSAQYALLVDTRWVMKWFNLLFMIHRAKLAQGMTPTLSKKWFNKYLPRTITLFMFVMMIGFTYGSLLINGVCATYSDIDGIQFCFHDVLDKKSQGGVFIFLGFDLVITVLLLVLFVVPLYRVYTADLGALNHNQLRRCALSTKLPRLSSCCPPLGIPRSFGC